MDEELDQREPATGGEMDFEECKLKLDEYLSGWKRAIADYQNREKELAREKQDYVRYVTASVTESLLPVLDNLRGAMTHVPEADREQAWVKGIALIIKQFEDALGANGVKPFSALGETFDPARHEAVGEEPGEEGRVAREVSVGYELGGKIIRPAKVIVGKGEDTAS